MPANFQILDGNPLFLVGASKNAGKTTALNYLANAYREASSKPPALVTIGIDGEEKDAIFGFAKPPVLIEKGDILCTSSEAVDRSDCDFSILASLDIGKDGNRLIIARAKSGGKVMLVGPDTNAQLETVVERLYDAGAGKVFVDGAFDRSTQIHSRRPVKVVLAAMPKQGEDETAFVLRVHAIASRYTLPRYEGGLKRFKAPPGWICLIGEKEKKKYATENWAALDLSQRRAALEAAREVHIGGPLTESLWRSFGEAFQSIIVISDPSRIFLSEESFRQTLKKKARLCIARDVSLELILLRSTGENSVSLSPRRVLAEARKRIKNIPVADAMLITDER